MGAIQQKPEGSLRPNSFAGDTPRLSPSGSESTSANADGRSANKTGLPNRLKSGIENLSGLSMDDVRVRYNSPKPAQLQALAYTQGTEIHVAPGQERHLAHEAWHVVQQKQGRVRTTRQMKGKAINDSPALEREADKMGAKALRTDGLVQRKTVRSTDTPSETVQRLESVIQLYPALLKGNAAGIAEERYATNDGSIQFDYFDSCLGIVGRAGTHLTGVHLVYIGANGIRLDGNADDAAGNKDNTALNVAAHLQGQLCTESKIVGDETGWDATASFFMRRLRNYLNALGAPSAAGINQTKGEWVVTYDNNNGWGYVNLR